MNLPEMLIVGKDGYLGAHLFHSPLLRTHFEVTGASRASGIRIDLSEPDSFSEMKEFLNTQKPATMVITAAISDVEKCAQNPRETRKVNVEGIQNRIRTSHEAGLTSASFRATRL